MTGAGDEPAAAVVHRGRLYSSIDEALEARDSAGPAGRPGHAGGSVSVRVPRSVLATWACRLEELSRSGPDDIAVVAHELAGRIALYAVRRDDSC